MANKQILLVEDESIEALDIKRTLESFGYEVPYIASNGEEAVDKALEIMPDLILMDIILKGDIDGIEAVSNIKERNIPVIYLTAHSEESTIERAKLTEPYGYIIKPYDRTELKYAIELAIYKNKLKNKLKDSETKYRTLFNQAADGILLIDGDKFIECNDRALEIYGTNREQLIGKTPYTVFSPEVQPNGEISEYIATRYINKALDGYPQHFEWEHLQYNGTQIYTEISLNRLKIKGHYLLQAIVRDITDRKLAEKALKESEEKFRAIAENSIDAILIAVEKGKHIYVNPKAVELTGYSKEELLNTQIEDIAHPDEIVNLKKRYNQRIAGKHIPTTYETRIVRKDNKIVPIEISAAKTTWKDQPAVMVQVRDITKRKKAELSLKKSEERFRAVAESAIDAIVTTDENGKIIFFNNSLTKIFGYTKEEITGKPLTLLMPTRYQKNYLIALKNFNESGKHRLIGKTVTTIGLKKDKSEFPFEMSLSTWKSEQKTYFTSIIRDLSEHQKAEKELHKSEGLLRGLFDNMPSGMSVYQVKNDGSKGSDYIIQEFNLTSQKIEGMRREEVIGKSLKDIRPEIDEYGLIPIFKKVWETGKPIQYPAKIYVDEKFSNYYENYIFKAPTGEIVAIYDDVTKQENAKENIQKSLEEKEILLREVNHRVKNNLQIVASLLHLQEINVHQKELVDILKESETRINTMATVHEKLYQSTNFADINLKQYIEKLVYDLLYTYGIKVGTIQAQLDIEDINLNIDTAIPLGLIINELITNSIKYAFPQSKGTITIQLKSQPQQMELTISDNGIGLPKDINIENPKKLGLQLVNNLINQLDGYLKLNTNNGTEFKITFQEVMYKKRI